MTTAEVNKSTVDNTNTSVEVEKVEDNPVYVVNARPDYNPTMQEVAEKYGIIPKRAGDVEARGKSKVFGLKCWCC